MRELGDLFHFSETFKYFKEGGKCENVQDGIGQRARANQFLNPKSDCLLLSHPRITLE